MFKRAWLFNWICKEKICSVFFQNSGIWLLPGIEHRLFSFVVGPNAMSLTSYNHRGPIIPVSFWEYEIPIHSYYSQILSNSESEPFQLAGTNTLTVSLQKGKTPLHSFNECHGYDIKQSDGEAPAVKLWGIWRTPSLPSLPGPLWHGMAAPQRVVSKGQIAVLHLTTYAKLTC